MRLTPHLRDKGVGGRRGCHNSGGDPVKNRLAALMAGLAGLAWGTASAGDVAGYKVLRLEGNPVHWKRTADGQRPFVSYTLVDKDTEFPRARNCRKLTSIATLLAYSGIETEAARQEIEAAFRMWESISDISFREAPSPEAADILIGAQADPEGWAFADVFYDVSSPEPVKPISKSLICLNPARRWKIGFDGDVKVYDLRYTIAHEIGHAIGLDHPSVGGQIMAYRYEESFRDLQPGDVAGAILIYGARRLEPADAVADRSALERAPDLTPIRRYSKRSATGTRAFTAPAR
jgi:hypothetical protein